MTFFARMLVGFVLGSLALVACAEPAIEEAPADPVARDKSGSKDEKSATKDDDLTSETGTPIEAQDVCADACTVGSKRCSATSGGGTEVCAKGASGCTLWTQGADCAAGSSCDKTRNDGSCVAGCTNDVGCSASNLGSETCATEGGRSRIKCTKVGECFRWAAASSCSPDEACHAGTCASKCTDACTLNTARCAGGRSRDMCVKGADGCTTWKATTGCSPDEQCSGGVCL